MRHTEEITVAIRADDAKESDKKGDVKCAVAFPALARWSAKGRLAGSDCRLGWQRRRPSPTSPRPLLRAPPLLLRPPLPRSSRSQRTKSSSSKSSRVRWRARSRRSDVNGALTRLLLAEIERYYAELERRSSTMDVLQDSAFQDVEEPVEDSLAEEEELAEPTVYGALRWPAGVGGKGSLTLCCVSAQSMASRSC